MTITQVGAQEDLKDVCEQLSSDGWGKDNEMAAYTPDGLARFLTNDLGVLFVGRVDGRIVCSALCYVLWHPDVTRRSLYVDELDTMPNYRRRGYASDMIAFLREYAGNNQLAEVWLTTEADDNEPTNTFYRSLNPTEELPCNLYSYSSKR